MKKDHLNGRVRLDTQTLEARAPRLPEIMREAFIWLGSFCREECAGEIDLLHKRFVDLGFTHDKTTWSKILRGMWNQDAAGKPTESPCLAEDKFLKAVSALQNDARIKELGGRIPFVMTPTAQRIFTFFDMKRAPDRVNKWAMLIGETGTQKTATINEYVRRNNHGSVVKVEAPETSSMVQFMTDVAACYGNTDRNGYLRKKTYVLSVVNAKRTIIVENIQRLYNAGTGDRQPIFSFLQKLQEDTNCTVILTLTPVFERTLIAGLNKAFFEQFEGRAGGRKNFLRLDPYPGEEDVLAIAKAFGLQDAGRHAAALVQIAKQPGRVRYLFEVLQDAKIMAGNGKLTISEVRECADIVDDSGGNATGNGEERK